MGRNLAIIGLFGLCVASVAVASGTITPVAYGVAESTTGTAATGWISTLVSLLSGAGGIWALLGKAAPVVGNVLKGINPADVLKLLQSGKLSLSDASKLLGGDVQGLINTSGQLIGDIKSGNVEAGAVHAAFLTLSGVAIKGVTAKTMEPSVMTDIASLAAKFAPEIAAK